MAVRVTDQGTKDVRTRKGKPANLDGFVSCIPHRLRGMNVI